jgi:general secretion pathway protein E
MNEPSDQRASERRDEEDPNLLGQRLIALGRISAEDVSQALTIQQAQGGRIGGILVRMGALSEETLLPAIAEQLGIPLLMAGGLSPSLLADAGTRLGLELEWMLAHRVLLWQDEQGQLNAAASDPLDIELNQLLSERLPGATLNWHLAREQDVDRILAAVSRGRQGEALDVSQLRELAEDAPVIALVNSLVAEAIDESASDVHVEPGETLFDIRFRVDGVLQTRTRLPMSQFPAVASRIKLIAHLDIAERRLPQDGRVTIRAAGQEMDIRVSVIPAVHGESIVLRLLPKQRHDIGLKNIGLAEDNLTQLQEWLDHPNGLVLVTGPTGSGKSTTLYSALAAANDLRRKIITVEDPVEYRLPRVVQIQVQAEIGYTFARALRSMLRHDPDIILVGEIRDRETAEIAIQAALTGHLVLATLHTNDALSAVTRLTDMGIEPYLVAASLRAVMAQRLVRRVCDGCSRSCRADDLLESAWNELRPRLPPQLSSMQPDWKAADGCPACRSSGFRGRLAVHELITVHPELRHAIASGSSLADQEAIADRHGRRSLRDDGLLKAAQGATTWDEVLRVVGGAVEPA